MMEGLKAATFLVLFLWLMGIVGRMDSEDAELLAKIERPSVNPLHVVNVTLGEKP
jgi:hypothetical protein